MKHEWDRPARLEMGARVFDCDALSYVVSAEAVLQAFRAGINGETGIDFVEECLISAEGFGKELREELACQL